MKSVIVSHEQDGHTTAVMWALRQSGHECALIDSNRLWHLQVEGVAFHTGEKGMDFDLPVSWGDQISLWNRRIRSIKILEEVAPEYQKHVLAEGREFENNLYHWLERSPRVFSINPLSRLIIAEQKTVQLHAATKCGLRVPETLISASPQHVRSFVANHSSLVIKPFFPHFWQDNEQLKAWATFANITTAAHVATLHDRDISIAPAIYQAHVPTVSDVRVAVIGDRIRCLEMRHRKAGGIDFRTMTDDTLVFGEVAIPGGVRASLLQLMAELGVNCAAADFVIDGNGVWWFLELNPSGSFLFIEEKCPSIRVLSSMASLLAFGEVVGDAEELFPTLDDFFQSNEGRAWKQSISEVKQEGQERANLTLVSA